MLRQTFTSQPFMYRLAADIPVTGFPTAHYHPELITPPRIYGEEYDSGGVTAIFLNQETLVDGYEVIYLLITQNQINWPGYLFRLHRWSASTGAYLGGLDSTVDPVFKTFNQDRNGTLWGCESVTTKRVFKYTIDTTLHDLVTDSVVQFDFSTFSDITLLNAFSIDIDANKMMGGSNSDFYLKVWNLSTGALENQIAVPGYPVVVMPEEVNRCYVLTSAGIVCLVDYSTLTVMSAFRVQTSFTAVSSYKTITWDGSYRRFLSWIYTPVDTTGQNTSVIAGYYPVPQPTYLTAPIPIRPPRKYLTTPILSRMCGDMGESVGGAQVALSLPPGTTIATIGGFPAITDGNGEAIGQINDLDSGSITLNAAATVP